MAVSLMCEQDTPKEQIVELNFFTKQNRRTHARMHTPGFIQDAWNSLPAWLTLLPEPAC